MDTEVVMEIERLRRVPFGELKAKYREVFGEEPRSHHKEQIFRRLAWRLQALAEGDLSERARQCALQLASDADLRRLAPKSFLNTGSTLAETVGTERSQARHDRRLPLPGTLLSRRYQRRNVLVKVLADGFEYEGQRFRSLSAIAYQITGTRWNGLVFFGLAGDQTAKQPKGAKRG